MAIDLSYLPIIDVHCHPYTRKEALTPAQWVDTISFGGGSAQYLADGRPVAAYTINDAAAAAALWQAGVAAVFSDDPASLLPR